MDTNSYKAFLVKELFDRTTLTDSAVRAMGKTPKLRQPTEVCVVDVSHLDAVIRATFAQGVRRYYRVRLSEVMI